MADGRDDSVNIAEPADRDRERELIQRAGRGEEGAFTQIVEAYRLDIARLAGRMLGWDPEVDDVVQEVLLSVYTNVSRFHHRCTLGSWIFRITVNKCRTHRLRRMLRWKRFVPAERMAIEPHAEAENRSLTQERDRAVRQAVRGLPGRYREPVVLRYLYGMETPEMLEILNIGRNALNVRLSRGRELLRERLADWFVD
jgi:RNA polymerase sigma-70 factor, ECF subfamily